MRARTMLLLPMSLLLLACGGPVQLTKPVPVKAEIPPHLRACADQAGTDPTTFRTRGDLMIGYGNERSLRMETQECVREIVRLLDFQNDAAVEPKVGSGRE